MRKIPQKNEREKQLCSLNITFSLLFLLFKILDTAHENLFLLRSSLFLYSFIKIYNIFVVYFQQYIVIPRRDDNDRRKGGMIGDIHC